MGVAAALLRLRRLRLGRRRGVLAAHRDSSFRRPCAAPSGEPIRVRKPRQPTRVHANRPAPTIQPMSQNRKRLFLALKTLLAVAVIVAVAREFTNTLNKPELASFEFRLRFEYLLPAGLLYLMAHCCWGSFWVRAPISRARRVRPEPRMLDP